MPAGFGPESLTMSRRRAAEERCMDDDEGMRKIASLKPDYLELQRETRAVKKRLQRARLKRDNLLAEVRFLRRRLKVLKQRNSSPKRAQEMAVGQITEPRAADIEFDSEARGSACNEEVAPPATAPEHCSPSDGCDASQTRPVSAREFQVFWEPLRAAGSSIVEASKRKPVVYNSGLVSVLKPPIFNNGANGCVTGKRKISWQDQISLKV